MNTKEFPFTFALGAIFQVTYRITPAELFAVMMEAKCVYEERHPDILLEIPTENGNLGERFYLDMTQFRDEDSDNQAYCHAFSVKLNGDKSVKEIRRGRSFAVWGDALTGERWNENKELTKILVDLMKGRLLA